MPPTEELVAILGAGGLRAAPRLAELLARLDPDAPHEAQLAALEELGRFVVAGPTQPGVAVQGLARLELVVVALERVPEARERFAATLQAIARQMRAVKLFGEVGLPNERGLWAETTDRLARRFLPEAPRTHELAWLVGRIVRRQSDLAWLGPAADPLLERLAAVAPWQVFRSSVLDAITLIATRIAALGTGEALRARSETQTVRDSTLYAVGAAPLDQLPSLIEPARRHLAHIHHALEHAGVSIDVVYSLDSIERGLSRLEILLALVADDRPSYAIRSVIAAAGNGLLGLRSFRQLVGDNTRLLARKVIERTGRSGEHYVTSSRREYWSMFRSAIGGGAVIVPLTICKFLIKWGHFVPFLDAVLASVAYCGAFLVMQLLHLTLATKQPSMTAAALAGSIHARPGPHQLDELVLLIARIARSQFAAIVGNIITVVAVALGFDLIYRQLTGASFLDPADAIASAESLDPLGSWTIVLAALTGVQLWISSLCAGWFENWIVYRRIPEAIEHHRLARRFGAARMARVARFLERQAAGFGGSISLGLLFGFLPQLGHFFGISLDGRHITITTTSLVLSASSAGIEGLGPDTFLWGCLGLVTVALCNFGVSFALALVVALRAREVPAEAQRRIPAALLRRFLRRPLEFFVPPRSDDPSPTAH